MMPELLGDAGSTDTVVKDVQVDAKRGLPRARCEFLSVRQGQVQGQV
jgi:hypothetical protein